MFKHVLVPTDGSPLSMKAVRMAADLARQNKARLTAIHVLPPYDAPMYGEAAIVYPPATREEYAKAARKEAEKMLSEVQSVAKDAHVACDTLAVDGSRPWQAIIDAARSQHCDLIVMASHGRHGLEALLLGSETNKVLTHSKTPVLVCH